MGACNNNAPYCKGADFKTGPVLMIIDKLIDETLGFSPIEALPEMYRYYSEGALSEKAAERKKQRRFALAGRKHGQETGYYFINAWMLGEISKDLEEIEKDQAAAILFRDSDGTNSSPSDMWDKKYLSMTEGFKRAEYDRGIPMLARPKSEAWFLCAAKSAPYEHCASLEELPGNDDSPNSAKRQLAEALGEAATTQVLNDWLYQHGLDQAALADQMPSFRKFRERGVVVFDSMKGN